MVNFCVLKHVLGEQTHIVFNTHSDEIRQAHEIPNDMWVYGDIDARMSLDCLAALNNQKLTYTPSEKFKKIFSCLANGCIVRWQHAVPSDTFQNFLASIKNDAAKLLNSTCVEYYTNTFLKTHDLLSSLKPAAIDMQLLQQFIDEEQNVSNKTTLESFRTVTGYTERIVYDRVSTITGRLIVKKGPKILTLAKQHKRILKSRYDCGVIVSLDYSSLEPRVALAVAKKTPPDDIYDFVSSQLFEGMIDRKQAKILTISLLYGASRATIENVSGIHGVDLDYTIKTLSTYLDTHELYDRLLHEAESTSGIIHNYYGRPIRIDDLKKLLIYFCQSTAADAALLGFSSVINEIKEKGLKIDPLFVIHDNLLLDVHPDYIKYISKLKELCENIEGFNVKFPIKSEVLCSTITS